MTGATSGFGRVVAARLASLGATVGIIARDTAKAERLRAELLNKKCGGIELFKADLNSLEEISQASEAIRKSFSRIDILINNAGVVKAKQEFSVDGFEMTIAVNHIAVHALTLRLLDRILAATTPRIVNVNSVGHRAALMSTREVTVAIETWRGEPQYNPFVAYSRSKLANLHFSYELAARLGRLATVNAVHPGTVRTNIGREISPLIVVPFHIFSMSSSRGAEPIIHLATSDAVAGMSGGYFDRMREAKSSRASYDETVRRQVWRETSLLTGVDHCPSGHHSADPHDFESRT
jgi:NAD(P)-dependent dehydrogenase (short-subunit alcohol dehydrogenase family)